MATVLIVDDDAAMREALAEVVRDLGHDARAAISGREALELLDREPANAVLLDLRMPGMDGLEVLRRTRARPQPPPVAVLTAHATATNTIEAMRLGAFDHLTKPIGRFELAHVIDRMIAGAAGRPFSTTAMPQDRLIGSSEADAAGAEDDRDARRQRRDRSDHRRDRDGQGTGGSRDPRSRSPRRGTLHRGQLRRDPDRAVGKRALRPRSGRLHWSGQRPGGSRSRGGWRNLVT